MNKKYFWWQWKQWVPLTIIFGVLLVSIFLGTCLSSQVFAYANSSGQIVSYPNSCILAIVIPIMLFTFVMPCFVYQIRFRRKNADFYLQAPFKNGEIRRTRYFVGLFILLTTFTAVYWLGVSILIVRDYLASPEGEVSPFSIWAYYAPGWTSVRYILYFGYFIPAYFFFVLAIVAQYSINCFLVGQTGSMFDGIITMLVPQLFLAGFLYAPLLYASMVSYNVGGGESIALDGLTMFPNLSVANPIIFGYRIFNSLIVTGQTEFIVTYQGEVTFFSILDIIMVFGYFALGGVATWRVLAAKEPSGEYYGKPGGLTVWSSLPLYLSGYVAAFLVATAGAAMSGILMLRFVTAWSVLSSFAVASYAILAIYHRRFKMPKVSLIHYFAMVGLALTLTIFAVAI